MDKEEFEWQKQLIKLKDYSKMKHARFVRETEMMKHDWELERGRIKSAEIRKTQERRYN